MLTADLVHARRHKGELRLVTLNDDARARALVIARQLHRIAVAHVGQTREELSEAWMAVRVGARERRLADGLKKLIDDGLDFEVESEGDPIALRREVFELATARRRELREDETFEPGLVLAEVAARRETDADAIARALFGDLKSAHVLRGVSAPPPEALVASYDLEQARAVLLRAVRVTAWVSDASPGALRALFRKLKFQRLLHTITREKDGYRVDIDGPFSLFESVTKYGLALAIALPAIASCGRWSLEAEVRWGKQRLPLVFRLEGGRESDDLPTRLPDEVQGLLDRFEGRKGPWKASVAEAILELPGVGLCVPDLVFTHASSGEVVYLEVMGFWSRDAVWKRVELARAGLPDKILFAVSQRLRVSEAVLDDDSPAALYVFKGTMSPKQIEAKLDALVS